MSSIIPVVKCCKEEEEESVLWLLPDIDILWHHGTWHGMTLQFRVYSMIDTPSLQRTITSTTEYTTSYSDWSTGQSNQTWRYHWTLHGRIAQEEIARAISAVKTCSEKTPTSDDVCKPWCVTASNKPDFKCPSILQPVLTLFFSTVPCFNTSLKTQLNYLVSISENPQLNILNLRVSTS